MNKLRRFLDRNSAETCLKMDYFGSRFQKSPSPGSASPQTLLRFNDYRMFKDPTSIEHFRMMQMLGNFEAK